MEPELEDLGPYDLAALLLYESRTLSPEQHLVLGVLRQAFEDLRSTRGVTRESVYWLCSRHIDPTPPFSCRWIMDLMQIDNRALIRLTARNLQYHSLKGLGL